jgi:hypothetical protein
LATAAAASAGDTINRNRNTKIKITWYSPGCSGGNFYSNECGNILDYNKSIAAATSVAGEARTVSVTIYSGARSSSAATEPSGSSGAGADLKTRTVNRCATATTTAAT